MALISWNESYSVRNNTIDEQHKKLINLINILHDAMKQAKGKEVLGGIIKELISYSIFHFSYEEKLMSKYNFPGTILHKMEHQKFTLKVQKLQNDYVSGKAILSQDVLQFLKDWLVEHIQVNDKKYVPFLVENSFEAQI